MALGDLSPWPPTTSAAARTAARDCVRSALSAPGLSDDRADALGGAAAALVEGFAPGAPQAVKNEAVIRLAGWLRSSPASDLAPGGVGSIDLQWRPAGRNALRNSGAAGLLSAWHRPRSTVIE